MSNQHPREGDTVKIRSDLFTVTRVTPTHVTVERRNEAGSLQLRLYTRGEFRAAQPEVVAA